MTAMLTAPPLTKNGEVCVKQESLGGVGPLTVLARSLRAEAAERAAQTEKDGQVSAEIVGALKQGGFFRGFQTKRFGGLEAHPADVFGAIIEMSSACTSTGWIMGIMGIHQFEVAKLPVALQQELLGDDPSALISSSYAPQGTAERVSGGFRLNGQWKSSSGVDHADWIVVTANVPSPTADEEPVNHIFYMPRADIRILDDWNVFGLRGTGSKSVILDNVFVPERRTSARGGFTGGNTPLSPSSDAPLYRLSQSLMYQLPGSAPAIGAAKGAYEQFVKLCKTRRPRLDGSSMILDPVVQKRVAIAKHTIETAEMRLMSSINEMMEAVQSGRDLTPEDHARYYWDFSRVGDDALNAGRTFFELMGAAAMYDDHPLGRFYRNLIAIRQHGTQDPDRGAIMVGRAALGLAA